MNKVIIAMIGDKCADTLELSLLSIKDIAKHILFVWGMEDEKTIKILEKFHQEHKIDMTILKNKWDNEDKEMNGKARNIYLQYIIQKFYDDWILVLDPDEFVENQNKVLEFINKKEKGIFSPRMRHFIWNFKFEDATKEKHYVPNRLFKIDYRMFYPLVEHPILCQMNSRETENTEDFTIWHLSYCRNMFDLKNKFEGNMKKSNMHSENFLIQWYYWHSFGAYPVKGIDYFDLPEILRKYFNFDKYIEWAIYFKDRANLEVKHFLMAKNWIDYFNKKYKYETPSFLDIGCGMGLFGKAIESYNCKYEGIELSENAVRINPFKLNIKQGDITNLNIPEKSKDICLCVDILEHLKEEDLEKALNNIKDIASVTIFSIPFIGDKNLLLDKTHRIFKTKGEWIKILSRYFKITEAPNEWLFSEQQLIGEKHEEQTH